MPKKTKKSVLAFKSNFTPRTNIKSRNIASCVTAGQSSENITKKVVEMYITYEKERFTYRDTKRKRDNKTDGKKIFIFHFRDKLFWRSYIFSMKLFSDKLVSQNEIKPSACIS